MEIVGNLKLLNGELEENSISLTNERASEKYIKFGENLYGALADKKSNNKKTLKIVELNKYLIEPTLKSKEFCILQFSLARGNNSGGSFDMSEYLFRNSEYIILTKVELYSASSYEWYGTLRSESLDGGSFTFRGGTTNLPKELSLKDNVILDVPGSADYWGAKFYGYVFNPDWLGKDIEQKQFNYHNLVKEEE